jgi:hypothetical protein
VWLAHDSDYSDATGCTDGFTFQERCELILVRIWQGCKYVHTLGHALHLVLSCNLGL